MARIVMRRWIPACFLGLPAGSASR